MGHPLNVRPDRLSGRSLMTHLMGDMCDVDPIFKHMGLPVK